MLKIKLTSGEEITGTPNYVTATHAEIRIAGTNGKVAGYRTIRRDLIEETARVNKLTGAITGTTVGDGII